MAHTQADNQHLLGLLFQLIGFLLLSAQKDRLIIRTPQNAYGLSVIVSLDQEKKEIVLHNYMDFVNLKDYVTVRYEVICDGLIKETGVVDSQELLDIPAHQERAVPVSFTVPESGKCFLKVTYIQKTPARFFPQDLSLDLRRLS